MPHTQQLSPRRSISNEDWISSQNLTILELKGTFLFYKDLIDKHMETVTYNGMTQGHFMFHGL